MFDTAVAKIKEFDWEKILSKATSLESFNDRQWRFMKGLIVELAVEKYSNNNLKYVGEEHKDYDWPALNLSVELKSMTSSKMYTKKGRLKSSYNIMFTNSLGTNNKKSLDNHEISDILLAVFSDGAFVIDKKIVLKFLQKKGDGFSVCIPYNKITPIMNYVPIIKNDDSILDMKDKILEIIKEKI